MPENRAEKTHGIDWAGTLLLLLALFGLAYGLVSEPSSGWRAPIVLAGLVGGSVCATLFIIAEMKAKNPLIPPGMFKSSLVSGSNVATLLLYFALSGVTFFTVLNLQQVQGFSPAQAGLRLLPTIVIITFLAGPAGALADRIGPRTPMALGSLIVAMGDALLVLGGPSGAYLPFFLPGLSLLGIGMSLLIAPLTKSALAVEPRFSGAASGVNNAVARIAALLAVAILGAVMISVFSTSLQHQISATGLDPGQQSAIVSQSGKLAGITIPSNFDARSHDQAGQAIARAFVTGYRWSMAICSVLALMACATCLIVLPRNPKIKPETPDPVSWCPKEKAARRRCHVIVILLTDIL